MTLCVCVFMFSLHLCAYVYHCVHIHACVCVFSCLRILVTIFVFECILICKFSYLYVCEYRLMYVYIYKYICIHMHVCIHVYHVCVCDSFEYTSMTLEILLFSFPTPLLEKSLLESGAVMLCLGSVSVGATLRLRASVVLPTDYSVTAVVGLTLS